VRDDGRGVAPGAPPGFGIRGMQERVEGLGGRFTIESASGGGTCVRVAVPLLEHRSAPSLVADAGDGAQA
jgi:two-component system sensor histidine kinase UhpB